MKLVNGQNKKYSIEIRCSKDDHSIVSLNCIANFPLNIGKYQIIILYVQITSIYSYISFYK